LNTESNTFNIRPFPEMSTTWLSAGLCRVSSTDALYFTTINFLQYKKTKGEAVSLKICYVCGWRKWISFGIISWTNFKGSRPCLLLLIPHCVRTPTHRRCSYGCYSNKLIWRYSWEILGNTLLSLSMASYSRSKSTTSFVCTFGSSDCHCWKSAINHFGITKGDWKTGCDVINMEYYLALNVKALSNPLCCPLVWKQKTSHCLLS
jgi:hypothetical protein